MDRNKAEIDGGPLQNTQSIFSLIEQGLHQNPHQTAVICLHESADHLHDLIGTKAEYQEVSESGNLTLTYYQLHQNALRLAAGLMANGVEPGSTILMLVPNGGCHALLLYTCIIARLTFVSFDPTEALNDQELGSIKSILEKVQPKAIIVSNTTETGVFDTIIDTVNIQKPLMITLANTEADNCTSLKTLALHGVNHPLNERILIEAARNDDADRLHSIMFTSGTSGVPKGCPLRTGGISHMLNSWSWLINHDNCSYALQQAHNSRGIAPLQMIQTWSKGGAVVMTGKGFNAPDMLEAIGQKYATFIVLTPPMVHSIFDYLEAKPLDLSSVKTVQVGGDAVTRQVLTKCMSIFPQAEVCINHGMTEGGACFRWLFSQDSPDTVPFFGQVCPVGEPAPGATVRIWDSNRRMVAEKGHAGELHLSSDSIIRGYLQGESEDSFYKKDGKRWFVTGDIAMMSANGIVYILGRSKDAMRFDNQIVMPFVIESCLEELTGKEASVVAIPHAKNGQAPYAVLRTLNQMSITEIAEHVVHTLGKSYQLSGIISLQALGLSGFPVNGTSKVIRTQLRDAVLAYTRRLEFSGIA